MKNPVLLFLLFSLLLPALPACTGDRPSDCGRTLARGIEAAYRVETLDAYGGYLREALNHSHDALAHDAETGGDFLTIPPAIAESILDAEASNPGIRGLLDGLRKKYSSDPTLALERADFEAMASNIVSGGILSAWEECRAKNGVRGGAREDAEGDVQDEFVYRINGAENESFSVTFIWLPRPQTDLPLLQVAGLTVTGGGTAHIPARIKEGTVFHRRTGYTQSFKWTDPRQDIFIRLDFQGHPGTEVVVSALKPRNIIPVGTVIQSMLKWEDYVKAVNDDPDYGPATSQWAPCDGHDIEGSELAELWAGDGAGHRIGDAKAPDLRGVFLRGLNRFVDDEEAAGLKAVSKERKDTGPGRVAGGFQPENVGGHSHGFSYVGSSFEHEHGEQKLRVRLQNGFTDDVPLRITGGPSGEPRPKNVAVFYYIKINR